MTAIAPTLTTAETPDGEMPCYLWLPEAGTGPGLVMVQEIFGVSQYIRTRSSDLARLGCVVLAPNLYWRLADDALDETRPDVLQSALALAGQLDWDLAVSDTSHALAALRDRPEVNGGVGLIGFCLGGGLAFNVAALDQPDVLVSYYGSALPSLLGLADQVTAPSLHHFGLADDYISPAVVEKITEAVTVGSNARVETYEGANHAFDNPSPLFHNSAASVAAWRTTTQFLADVLPVNSARSRAV